MNNCRATWPLLLLPLLLAGAVRAMYWAELRRTPEYRAPQVDAAYNHAWAVAWATGDWENADPALALPEVRRHVHFRPPGYGYFLGTLYRCCGIWPWVPRLVQMLLGLLTVGGVMRLTHAWGGGRKGAMFAGVFAALYWPSVHYEGELLDTALLSALFVLFLLVNTQAWLRKEGPTLGQGLVIGVIAGCAALTRPNMLAVMPVLAVAWFVRGLTREKARNAERSTLNAEGVTLNAEGVTLNAERVTLNALLRMARPVLFLTLGTLLPIVPVTLRNWQAEGQFVLISANAGINLYIGNKPGATGLFSTDLGPWGRYGNNEDFKQVYGRIGRELGYSPTYAEASRFLSREAWREMRAAPGRAVLRMGRKLFYWLGPREVSLNSEVEVTRRESGVLRWLPVGFSSILALGLAGLLLAGGRQGAAARELTGLVAGAYTLSFMPFFVAGQYRAVLAVPLLALAGVAAATAGTQWRQWRLQGVLLRTGLLVLLIAACSVNVLGYRATGVGWWFSRGNAFKALGETADAVAAWRKSLELAVVPAASVSDRRVGAAAAKSAGVALIGAKRPDEAARLLRVALACVPGDVELSANLGVALLSSGQPEAAVAILESACRKQPGNEALRANLEAARAAAMRNKQR